MQTPENPYWPMANRTVATVLAQTDETLAQKNIAGNVFWLAWGYTSPHSHKKGDAQVLAKCVWLWDQVAAKYAAQKKPDDFPDGTFWNHLPYLESLRYLEPVQEIDAAKKAAWKAALRPQIEDDFQGYGHVSAENWATSAAKFYPNADAQHLAVMYLGYLVYGEKKYKENAEEFVRAMDTQLRSGGGWLYYKGSTPIPLYHGFEIIFLGRYFQLSQDPLAADQIRRTVDYYPYTYVPENTVEFSSSPWWKQMWNPVGGPYHAPELVAAITGDGRNRWLADLRSKSYFNHYWTVYCGEAWDPNIKPQPFPDNFIVADSNIDGLRGRSGPFSWVGSRGKNTMSFAGCMMADAKLPLGYDAFLQFAHIGIEVPDAAGKPYYQSLRLIADPEQTPTSGSQVIGKNYAALAVSYIPRLELKPEVAYDDWKAVEMWLFTPQGIVGSLQVTALKNNPGTLPQGLMRFGPIARPSDLQEDIFRIGNLQGRLLQSSFKQVEMREGPTDEHQSERRLELNLQLDAKPDLVRKGDKFSYIVQFSPASASVIASQVKRESGELESFSLQMNGKSYQMLFNASPDKKLVRGKSFSAYSLQASP